MHTISYHKIQSGDSRYTDLFRLRYRVYCDECGFEDPLDHPDMMERDEYDEHSVHFCNLLEDNDNNELIGTVRMILDSEQGFPIEKHFLIDEKLLPDFKRSKIAEISRLAISNKFRRRIADKILYSKKVAGFTRKNGVYRKERLRLDRNLTLGLYHYIYHESLKRGLTHWYASMTDGLCSLLSSKGCVWHPIGPRIDHHGFRRPYIASIAENAGAARRNLRLNIS